jgi:hypothetical protein
MPMPQRKPFPPESETRPNAKAIAARQSSPAPKTARQRSEAPTVPPPPRTAARQPTENESGVVRTRGKSVSNVRAARPVNAATVDEVTADMSRDPRRER